MRILLTNDDGIHAMGLCALYEALREDHDLIVVAPESERSAVGHAITLVDPLRARAVKREGRFFGWAISGTPADCVKLALAELVQGDIDFVISGINQGANVGINVLYSGTVSAATEAAILGLPSCAVSLDAIRDPDFCYAADFVRENTSWLESLNMPKGVSVNINIPALPPHRIRGVRLTRQGLAKYEENFDKRMDPRGNIYYWQCSQRLAEIEPSTVDSTALREGYITVTPVQYDLTANAVLERLSLPRP